VFGSLKVKSAYLDGDLCALLSDGVPVFSRLQAAMDEGRTDQLVHVRSRMDAHVALLDWSMP
jgi:hypothetical protein